MCTPISVATGGATGGCTGMCRFMPQIIASLSVFGLLALNFKGLLFKALSWKPLSLSRKIA